MEGCSAGAAAGLPDDPLVEILSRVPAKSICRFKCVSKAWRDLIAHPDHRKKLRQAMQGLFFMTSRTSEADDSVLMMCFGFINLTSRTKPLDIDPCFSFLTDLPGIQVLVLLDSCNGLILFSHHKDFASDTLGYIVCNPTTKQWAAVPFGGSPSRQHLTNTKLAFDPAVSSHFYLVQFVMDEEGDLNSFYAYSSETGIWSHNQIDEQEEQGEFEGWHRWFDLKLMTVPSMPDCAFVNGFLHFLVSGPLLDQIVALDVQGKARRMIKVPALDHRRQRRGLCYLGQSQGQLHFMTQELRRRRGEKRTLYIWVLQDYDKEEWELKDTVNSTVFEEFGDCIDPKSDLLVVCIHPDRNVVFFKHASRLIVYDMDCREARVVTALGDEKQFWCFARCVPCFSELPSLTNEH